MNSSTNLVADFMGSRLPEFPPQRVLEEFGDGRPSVDGLYLGLPPEVFVHVKRCRRSLYFLLFVLVCHLSSYQYLLRWYIMINQYSEGLSNHTEIPALVQ